MPATKQSDEIDLVKLLLKFVTTLRNNFWLIVIFFLAGATLGVIHFFTSRKVFENKMIVSSNILTNSYANILFQNVNRHLEEGDRTVIATQLHISPETVTQLLSLKIESVRRDEVNNANERDRFLITVNVFDQGILPELQAGILSYLEENEYVKTRTEQTRKTSKQMLAAIEKEIADIETFKKGVISGEFFQSAKGNVMFDPTTVNSKIIELTEKKLTLQNSLELSNSVYVIEGFDKFQKQNKPKLSISLTAGCFIGLFFVGVLMAFKSIRGLLRMADASK